jgi:hypothetical protein
VSKSSFEREYPRPSDPAMLAAWEKARREEEAQDNSGKFVAVRAVSWVIRTVGAVAVIAAVILGYELWFGGQQPPEGVTRGVLTVLLAGGCTVAVILIAVGELLQCVVSIEENTRNTALWLRDHRSAPH